MAWCWSGADQATSHCLTQWWLNHRCIYASLGLSELRKLALNVKHHDMSGCISRVAYVQILSRPVPKYIETKTKIAAIAQMTCSNASSSMINKNVDKIHWCFFLWVQLTISSIGSGKWHGTDKARSHHMNQWWTSLVPAYASLDLNGLINGLLCKVSPRTEKSRRSSLALRLHKEYFETQLYGCLVHQGNQLL